MGTTMTVEYDCGYVLSIPLVLREDQTMLGNAALGDQMILLADATHDAQCTTCG